MVDSVCVEVKTFEVVRGGGVFPFRITEFSRRRRFFVSLTIEFRWLAVELVHFCSSKGDPFWVRTFRWNQKMLASPAEEKFKWKIHHALTLCLLGSVKDIGFP